MALNPLISKARRPKFDLNLRIIDLNNVPLAVGTALIKYSLPSSSVSGEHTGRTERCPIKDHYCIFDFSALHSVRLTIDKNNILLDCPVHFEVLQEFHSHSINVKAERLKLGTLVLNLAEYVEESEQYGEEGVVRRYLLADSKVNSTVKIGISMRQVDGERGFVAPPLKSAPVFGGIAGVMREDVEENVGEVPHLNLSKTRDHSELHDVYRRSLAASWAAHPGELPADQCVEDIFNGGDGWKDTREGETLNDSSEDHHGHRRQRSDVTVTRKPVGGYKHSHSGSRETLVGKGRGSESSLPLTGDNSESSDSLREQGSQRGRARTGMRDAAEVDEFAVRDDLIAWKLPGTVR